MKKLAEFILPLAGLNPGIHEYRFEIDRDFLGAFEHSLVDEGQILAEVVLDKQHTMMTLDIHIQGNIGTECDRCLAAIQLPVEGGERILFKFAEEEKEEDEVLYIHPKTGELNIAPFIFECITLAVPMIRTFDCEEEEPRPCNEEVLSRIQGSAAEDGKDDDSDSPFRDALKDWN